MKLKSNERNIWFTSDTHFGHKNIVRGVSDWNDLSGCRNFESVDKMNDAIVHGINKYVDSNDLLIHLGDWSMGGIDNVWKFRKRLNVKDILLIPGNHDEHILNNRVFDFPKVCHTDFWFLDQFIEDDGTVSKYEVSAQAMFSDYGINQYSELYIDKIPIILCHFPITSWNRAYRGAWMLHGHTHGTLFKQENNNHWYHKSKILDVGLDTAFSMFGEYRPFSFKGIKGIMSKRKFISIDQHDEKTNG